MKDLNKIYTKEELVEIPFEPLLEYHKNFIYNIVEKYLVNYPKLKDELFQCGRIGLWKAYEKFVGGKKANFSTYSTAVINNEIKMFLRLEKKSTHIRKKDKETGKQVYTKVIEDNFSSRINQEDFSYQDYEGTDADYFINNMCSVTDDNVIDDIMLNDYAKNKLSKQDYEVYNLKKNGYKLAEISEKLGKNKAWVSRRCRIILDIMKGYFKE